MKSMCVHRVKSHGLCIVNSHEFWIKCPWVFGHVFFSWLIYKMLNMCFLLNTLYNTKTTVFCSSKIYSTHRFLHRAHLHRAQLWAILNNTIAKQRSTYTHRHTYTRAHIHTCLFLYWEETPAKILFFYFLFEMFSNLFSVICITKYI